MLWFLICAVLTWLISRECRMAWVTPPGFDKPLQKQVSKRTIAILLALMALASWPMIQYNRFEKSLSHHATLIAEGRRAQVHCNTIYDSFTDRASSFAAHANPTSGEIVFQYPWCNNLLGYLAHPGRASKEELHSLRILTHESMHVRGEMNEALTECQALQRNYRVAKMLGVPDWIAKKNAKDIYNLYMIRHFQWMGNYADNYYSPECAPSRAMDEHLADSSWYVR